jgi:uncharacterized membrane protein
MIKYIKEKIKNCGGIKAVWAFVFIYTIILTSFSFWKYFNFLYNGLDLAIFNQVFFNTAAGRFFDFSIHPHSYLGDHFIPAILFLTPVYSIFKSPLILLFLQSFFLGLTAMPVYLIAKEVFKNRNISLIISGAVLFNPILWNINIFEFHVLPVALPLLLFTFYFYKKKNFKLFVLFIFLSLLVREDVSLMVLMLGFLPFLEIKRLKDFWVTLKKNKKWIFFPIIISSIWFIASFKLIAYFNPDSSYKFLIYYNWLGESSGLVGLIFNLLSNPLGIFFHLFTYNNFVIIFILFFCFLFLPLFSKKYLILILPHFLQIFLSDQGGSSLVFTTHYAVFFVFVLIISSIYGLKNFFIFRENKKNKWAQVDDARGKKIIDFKSTFKILIKDRIFLVIFFIVATIYLNLFIGPSWGLFKGFFDSEIRNERIILSKLVNIIPPDSSVVASYRFLSNLSSRENLYSLHYAFTGKKQFFLGDYTLPDNIDYFIIDANDFITYQLQFQNKEGFHDQYMTGGFRIREYLKDFRIIKFVDSYILFGRGDGDLGVLFVEQKKPPVGGSEFILFKDKIKLNSNECFIASEFNKDKLVLKCSFSWLINQDLDKNYQLVLETVKGDEVVGQKIYPLSYGLLPSSEWTPENEIINHYNFIVPKSFLEKENSLGVRLVDINSGHVELNKFGSVIDFIEEVDYSDEFYELRP